MNPECVEGMFASYDSFLLFKSFSLFFIYNCRTKEAAADQREQAHLKTLVRSLPSVDAHVVTIPAHRERVLATHRTGEAFLAPLLPYLCYRSTD